MDEARTRLLKEVAGFLSLAGPRPRALVVVGERGTGKSTFLEQAQVEALAAGRTKLVVVDDAHELDAHAIDAVRSKLAADARSCLLVAGMDPLPDELVRLVDANCERRLVELRPLADDAVRAMLVELGHQPSTYFVEQVIARAGGNPRAAIDASFGDFDVGGLPARDSSLDPDHTCEPIVARLETAYASDTAAADSLVERLLVQSGDPDPDVRSSALCALAEIALNESDLELAVQRGEMVAASDGARDSVRILGSIAAGAARALRGEPTAMLSLHALAGRASRANLAIVEAMAWYRIAWCAGILGDVTTSRRAAARSIQLADANDAIIHGVRARMLLLELHLAANEGEPALEYLRELAVIAEHRNLPGLALDAARNSARACLLAGRIDEACRYADQALEFVVQRGEIRFGLVDCSVIAARAYAAAGSVELALAPLEALMADLGDSHSPDFWLVLEAVRVLGKAGNDPAAFKKWLAVLGQFDADGHGGALRAAHAEADAWAAAIEGRKAEAARLAERARQLWIEAECHDELPLTQPIIDQAPLEHGARISLVGNPTGPIEDPEAFEVLTKREREIARYVAGGLTNPEIASELHLSPRTVEHHVASILRKLELPNRRALVRGQV